MAVEITYEDLKALLSFKVPDADMTPAMKAEQARLYAKYKNGATWKGQPLPDGMGLLVVFRKMEEERAAALASGSSSNKAVLVLFALAVIWIMWKH